MSKVRADNYANRLGTGAPLFPNGIIVSTAATFSEIQVLSGGINVVGIVTASSISVGGRIVSTLGVGINTSGGNVGYGATLLDFRGSGISTVTVSSGIATINIAGGGGATFNPISFVMSI
jgi:hypothetical protein